MGRPVEVEHVKPLRKLALLALPLVLLSLTLAGCEWPAIFRPESDNATDIRNLAVWMFAIMAGVLLFVWGWLLVDIVRFRNRPESAVKQTHGNMRVELIWTLIPAIIVVVLFYLTMQTTGQVTGAIPLQVDMKVTAYQWWWGIEYRSGQFTTANEIHAPVDRTITADLATSDVIHSFWVPQMGGKLDMVPGHINTIHFVPTKVGSYIGQCSEYCGHQHARMRFLFFVDTAEDFTRWFDNERGPARSPVGPRATAGAQTITRLPCVGCHTIRGNDAMRGVQGPDLTHVGNRTTLAAVTLKNTPDNMRRWLRDPQEVKPENLMPTIPLTPQQLDELVAYLEGLK